MRKLVFPLAAFFLLVYCNNRPSGHETTASQSETSAPQAATPLDLKIKVNGFANGKVKLIGFYGDQNWVLDSAMVDAQDSVNFKRDTAIYQGMYFLAFPDQKFAQILIGPEQNITLEFSKDDPVNTMKVQGSLDTELLYQNLRFEANIQRKFDSIKKRMDASAKGSPEYLQAEQEQNNAIAERKAHIQSFKDKYPNAFFTKFKIAGQNPEVRNLTLPDGKPNDQLQVYHYRNDFWNGVDFSDVRLLRTPVYFNKLKRYMKELTPQVTDSLTKYADIVTTKAKANKEIFKYTANWIAINYKETKVMGLEAVYVHMVDKYWTRDQAWWSDSIEIAGLRREVSLMKPSLIGQTGQDLRAKNEFGQYISMYDIKTPFIVLYIFSYECENCQEETPKLVKVMNEWKQKGMADLFTLGIEGTEEGWKEYIKKTGLSPTFRNIFDLNQESKYPRKYHVDVTPEIYVLDKDRKIIGSNLHADQLPRLFEQAQ